MESGSTSFGIRQLGVDDIGLMRAMLAMFSEAFDDPTSYGAAPPSADYLTRLLGRDHFLALVATKDGDVVGGLCAYFLDKFEQQRSEVYIYDLAVAERHRRQGIGEGLITTLQDIASKRGAYVIFVQADPPDAPAVALYRKLGVQEEVLHFDIPVRHAT